MNGVIDLGRSKVSYCFFVTAFKLARAMEVKQRRAGKLAFRQSDHLSS